MLKTHPEWQIANGKWQNPVVLPSAICHLPSAICHLPFAIRPALFSGLPFSF
jgi:hypothetical protein